LPRSVAFSPANGAWHGIRSKARTPCASATHLRIPLPRPPIRSFLTRFHLSREQARALVRRKINYDDSKLDFSPSRYILSVFVGSDEADKMVADALVYHPTVSHYLKFVATTGMLPLLVSSIPTIQSVIPASSHFTSETPVSPSPVSYIPTCTSLTNPSFQSGATRSSALSNTSPASSPGTCTAPTDPLRPSPRMKRPRRPSARRAS